MKRIFVLLLPIIHGFIHLPESLDDLSLLEDHPLEFTVNADTTHVYANNALFLAKENDPVHPTKNLAASKLLTKEQDQALLSQWSHGFADPFPAFGRCSSEETVLATDIDIYIVIDICPTSDECKVIRTWSIQLQEYVRNQYHTACRLHFIADPDCKHLMTIIEDINWQLENPELVFLSAHEPWHPSFTAHPESLSYAINLISRDRSYIQHYTELEYKAKITEHFDFFVCGKDDIYCKPGTETSTGVVQLGVITDLIKYSNLRIVKEFQCPEVENSVPVEFYYEGKHHCACRCPAGYELNGPNEGQRKCVKIQNKCKCRWIDQCYEYKVTSEWRDRACDIQDWHSRNGFVPIPMVLDNYVGFKINPSDYEDNGVGKSLNQPCVQLSIEDIDGDPRQVFTVDYSWKYFQENRYYIFNSISITHAGRYRLTIKAFDYGMSPAICSVIIAVIDDHPPYSALQEKCPEEMEIGGDMTFCGGRIAEFSPENTRTADDFVRDYRLWYNARDNDLCGEEPNTDCASHPEDFDLVRFGSVPDTLRKSAIDINGTEDCFILTSTDLNFLAIDFWEGNLDPTTVLPDAKYCTKCCLLDHTFSEYYYRYRCKEDQDLTNVYCQLGDGCAFHQCLRAEKNTFFEARSSIRNDILHPYVNDTEDVIGNYRENGYNSVDEIHTVLNCLAYNDCLNFHDFKNMFHLDVDFTSIATANLFGQTMLHETSPFIRWRFKIQGTQDWVYYDPLSGYEHNFNTDFSLYVDFEALSACGIICSFRYYIYTHIKSPLKICESFDTYAFYQTSNYQPTSQFCNYPRADWAELTFDWNPAEVIETRSNKTDRHLQYHFKRMECDVCLDDTAPIRNFITWDKSERFLDRYAILLSEYPTQASTKLTWKCRVTYWDYANVESTIECPHNMEFYDCDPPQIDCPWSECQVNCTDNEQHPYQICGGNQLYKSDRDTTSFSGDGKTCCDKCNTKPGDTTCSSIFDYIDQNSLYYCKVGSHQYLEGYEDLNQRTVEQSRNGKQVCGEDYYHDKMGDCALCPDGMTAKGTDQTSIDDCYCTAANVIQLGRECIPCDSCIEQDYFNPLNFIQIASASNQMVAEFEAGVPSPKRYEGAGAPNACPTSTTGHSFAQYPGSMVINDFHFKVRFNAYKLSKLSVDLIDFGDYNPNTIKYETSTVKLEAIPDSLNFDDYTSQYTTVGVIYGDACYNPPNAAAMANWHGQEQLEVTGTGIEGGQITAKTKLLPASPANPGALGPWVDYFGDPGSAFSTVCYTVDFTCNEVDPDQCYDIPNNVSPWNANTYADNMFDYAGCVALCKSKGHCWGVRWQEGATEPPFGNALIAESGTYPHRCTLLFGDFATRDCVLNEERQCAVSNAPKLHDNEPETPGDLAVFVSEPDLCYDVPDSSEFATIHLYTYSLKACRELCELITCEAFEYHFRDEVVNPSERKCVIIHNRQALSPAFCTHAVTYIRKPPTVTSLMAISTIPSGSGVALIGVLISCILLYVGKTILQQEQVETFVDSYQPLL